MYPKSTKAIKQFVVGKIKCQLATPFVLVFLITPIATAQTTAFTYQGKLTDGGVPPTGNYDIRIQLYDALTGGNVICGAQGSPNVSVVNGSFTLQLDFGSEACFPFGSNRYLEVAVRPTGSPNPHTVLSPRQQILSAPYSMKSLKALDTNNAINAQLATNALSLGGFAASLYLRTNGDGSALTNLNASSITSGTLGDARLSSNIARLDAANQTFTGKVGIGTTTPAHALQVNGITSLGPSGSTYGYLVDGFFPGPYPTLGFNTYFTPNPITYRAGATGGGGVFQFQNGDGKLIYYTAPNANTDSAFSFTPRFTITNDGNVGIGTTTPTAALHVSGDMHVSGSAFFTSPGTAVTAHTSGNGAFSIGIYGSGLSGGYAGYFEGKVAITNTPGGGIFQMCRDINLVVADCSSSLRYKKELQPFVDGLNIIKQLRPIAFKWKSSDTPDVGFGAEDVEKIDPLFVTYNQKGEVEGVKYDRLSVVFVNAIKEHQTKIEEHRTLLERQQQELEQYRKQLMVQQREMGVLKRLICRSNAKAQVCRAMRRKP